MLDVEGCVDVDAGGDELLDIHVALGVPAARCVAARQLIDQGELWTACQHCIDVHLPQRPIAILDRTLRDGLQTVEQCLSLAPPMRLYHRDDDIDAFLVARASGGEHLVGLAHAWGGAEEDLQPAARILLCAPQQRVGGRPAFT